MKSKTYQIIFKEIGNLMILMGFILLTPIGIALIYNEWYSAIGFLLSGLISFIFGLSFRFIFRDSLEIQHIHGYIIAALGWLVMVVLGGLPFFIISHITPASVLQAFIPNGATYSSSLLYFHNPLHCIFESMSAYTTTGLTLTVHEPSVGKTVLFYRSFAQWVGGAGFIVLALAIMKHDSGRSLKLLYKSESTGINLRTKVMDTAKSIWKSYLIITFITIIYLIIGTKFILPDYKFTEIIFDSVNHAMCGLSTGGFSTLDDSIGGYQSAAMEYLYLLPMILGAFSLPFYFRLFYNRKFNELWRDIQTRSLLFCFFFGAIILSLLLLYSHTASNPFREGIYQFISAMSTTGWQTSDIHIWDNRSFLFITFFAMFIGGAWGGTVGGIKIYRAIFLLKGIRWQIKKSFFTHNTIKTLKFDGKVMLPDEANAEIASTAIFSVLFLIIIFASTFICTFFVCEQYSFFDILFESTSAQSTAGLSVGITNPTMHPIVEIIYIIQMWVGRLEIIPVLVLLRSAMLGTNPKTL